MSPEIMTVSAARSKNVVERCNDLLQTPLDEIGNMIRVEIRALEKARDDALRSRMHDQKDPMTFVYEMNDVYHESSKALLSLVRPELHKAIESLMDELDNETMIKETFGPRRLLTPPTPTSSRRRLGAPAPAPAPETPGQPRAPVAEMDSDMFSPMNRARSVTMPALEHPPAPNGPASSVVHHSRDQTDRTVAHTTPPAPGPITPASAQSKRAGADVVSTTPSKRAKTSTTTEKAPKTATPSKKTAASSSTAPKTPTSRGKKTAATRAMHAGDDDEYQQSQTISDAELEAEFPPIHEIRSKELAHRAAKGKNVVYVDKPLRDDEFLET
ncbi:hypothetical protein E8E14_012838 [Neopestalotiopsis sp. 37M]|nr:hypothetical protein E8E14_012838 [Neopestalotiopsis sp. 37M]